MARTEDVLKGCPVAHRWFKGWKGDSTKKGLGAGEGEFSVGCDEAFVVDGFTVPGKAKARDDARSNVDVGTGGPGTLEAVDGTFGSYTVADLREVTRSMQRGSADGPLTQDGPVLATGVHPAVDAFTPWQQLTRVSFRIRSPATMTPREARVTLFANIDEAVPADRSTTGSGGVILEAGTVVGSSVNFRDEGVDLFF